VGQGSETIPDDYDDLICEQMGERNRRHRQQERSLKNKVHAEVAAQLKRHGISKTPARPKGAKVDCQCKNCGIPFTARKADRARGWARFCSKSCAAIFKDRAYHGRYRGSYGS